MIWKFYQEFVLNVEGSYHSNASISVALVSTVDVLCVESVNIRCKIHQREEQDEENWKNKGENPEYVKERNMKDAETRHTNIDSIKKAMVRAAKKRASTKGLEFDITYEDIELPKVCPLLGITLGVSPGRASDSSYSLDRIDSSKGYIRGNIWVISNKANVIKNNATLEELELLTQNLKIKLDSMK